MEDRFGLAIRHFCYPYGDHDESIREWVAEAGYSAAATTEFGANRRGVHPLGLRRVIAHNGPSSPDDAARKMAPPAQLR